MPRRFQLSANAVVSLVGLFIGVLILTGLLSFHALFLIPAPSSGSFPPTNPDVIAYRNTVRLLGWISIIAMDLSVALSVMIAWIVGSLKGEYSEAMRRGIFVFSSVYLAVWLVFSTFAYALLRSLIPSG